MAAPYVPARGGLVWLQFNPQTLINDALLEHAHRRSTIDVVRQAVREELAPYGARRRSDIALQPRRR